MRQFDPTMYFITDRTGRSTEDFLWRIEQACQGGVTLVQLREKDIPTRTYLELAMAVHTITKSYQIPLIIDDRVDVALAAGAEGVHIGQTDLPVRLARALMGEHAIIGATTKTVPQALEAYEQGVDYLGVGAIYPTTTKVKTVLTDVSVLREICQTVPLPVCAIGGLNYDNCDVLQGSGIAGVAVVSAIMKADDPKAAAEQLKAKVQTLIPK